LSFFKPIDYFKNPWWSEAFCDSQAFDNFLMGLSIPQKSSEIFSSSNPPSHDGELAWCLILCRHESFCDLMCAAECQWCMYELQKNMILLLHIFLLSAHFFLVGHRFLFTVPAKSSVWFSSCL
jgi:hypothetical protein